MPTVAEQLRAARESHGLTIHQVADATKMRGDHVEALEHGNYSVFPAPVYIRGSVRTYANLLKLDHAPLLAALEHELSGREEAHSAGSIVPQPHGWLDELMLVLSKVNWRITLPAVASIILIVLGLAAYGSWQDRRARDPLRDLGPGRHQTSNTPGDTLPLPASPRR